ncbi:MAG: YigZ family protein [Nanoarchaeales archaeon]|nr:YigZ family protein [Nanoarchaeales archaeon]
MKTTYKTLQSNSTYTHQTQKSKFIAYTFKINSRDKIKKIIKQLKLEHSKSNHIAHAFRVGILNQEIGFSDDGEPTGSAGKPIYFEIKGKELQNILICVVRYFGGIKLGVGGLTKAFSTTAKNVIELENKIIELKICDKYTVEFEYEKIKLIETFTNKNKIEISKKEFDNVCKFEIKVPINQTKQIEEFLKINNIKSIKTKLN